MNNGFVLITGLPLHKGHEQIVRWAKNFGVDKLTVFICGTDKDPLPLHDRVAAAHNAFYDLGVSVMALRHNLPDYPEQFHSTVAQFDALWSAEIQKYVTLDSGDFMFGSDTYGRRFAEAMGVTFIPFDPDRETVKISATNIRRNPYANFHVIAPTMQTFLQRDVTFFGAESTGKTTISKKMAAKFNSTYVSEWARPYLESLESPEVTDARMETIVRGQRASQISSRSVKGNPFTFFDTDLFSTLGYFRIYGGGSEEVVERCEAEAVYRRSDLYVVMNSNIRFTPDPLRYGLTKRESADKFWIDLLEEFDMNYYRVQSTNPHSQEAEVEDMLDKWFRKENPVFGYERVR